MIWNGSKFFLEIGNLWRPVFLKNNNFLIFCFDTLRAKICPFFRAIISRVPCESCFLAMLKKKGLKYLQRVIDPWIIDPFWDCNIFKVFVKNNRFILNGELLKIRLLNYFKVLHQFSLRFSGYAILSTSILAKSWS